MTRENIASTRVYIAYETNLKTLAPQHISIHRSPPKHMFFYDSKLAPVYYKLCDKLILVLIKMNDAGFVKWEFYGFLDNIHDSKDNITHYVHNINEYPDKKVEGVFYLELTLNE